MKDISHKVDVSKEDIIADKERIFQQLMNLADDREGHV